MNNFEDQIRTAAENAQESTPQYLWNKLERKIDRNQQKKQISLYRSLAIASSMIALVAVLSLVYYNSSQYNPDLLAYTLDENLHLEELTPESDDFYNTTHVEQLIQWREMISGDGSVLKY